MTDTAPLTRDAMFDFEREWWKYAGAKPAAIEARFGVPPSTYHRALDQVIATDEALAHDRTLALRLRRLSAQRQRQHARRNPT